MCSFRGKPLLTFHIESVNKDFFTSIQGRKPLYNLWCLKCKGKSFYFIY